MASINEKELTRIIKSGELSGAYYLYGTDRYMVEKFFRAMISKTVKKGDEAYNLHRFEGRDLDVEGLAEVCDAFPMFADKLCVAVSDLDMEEETKQRAGHKSITSDRMKLLTETVSNLPDTTVLIFAALNIDVCGGKKFPAPKNKKLIDLVSKHGTVCELNIKTRAENIRTIVSRITKLGSTIDERAAGMIFDRCGGDMLMIMNEADKLASYANGGNITESDVAALTPDTSDAKSYDLANAVAAGNMSRSMELYSELMADPENTPVYLLYVLAGSMNDLYRARLAIDSGKNVGSVMKDFGYAANLEFRVKNAFSSVRKTSTERLRRCLEILSSADLDMKSGAGDPEIILEKAIVAMLSERF
ncbi:MAG: DNA polymerase III subunit delta [Oscillospiraceae bacterium]|nr:DNA polymerase III subunit delta [Oscillospiraceae bacterium]